MALLHGLIIKQPCNSILYNMLQSACCTGSLTEQHLFWRQQGFSSGHCTAGGQPCKVWAAALQVFDKALTETTFCEIYADLCFQLNTALPSFEPPSQDANRRPPSTFRSALHLALVLLFAWHVYACSLLELYNLATRSAKHHHCHQQQICPSTTKTAGKSCKVHDWLLMS